MSHVLGIYFLLARRRLAGAERGLRGSQFALHPFCERVCAAEHAPRGPFNLLGRRHGLAEIVERGAGLEVTRLEKPDFYLAEDAYANALQTPRQRKTATQMNMYNNT